MQTAANISEELHRLGSPERAAGLSRFFKTGAGQYGEDDAFIGVTVPEQRLVARRYRTLPLTEIDKLLAGRFHEERLTGLIILTSQFQRSKVALQEAIYTFYLAHTARINNWDLVDGSAEFIVGPWLEDRDRSPIFKLAQSRSLWERRIAMLSTFHYIKQDDPDDALRVAAILLQDREDLIQKAVGWMLREIGKRCSEEIEETFLAQHYKSMPRTMLRYAIERFPADRRRKYLSGRA
jgi:3-methyladenine DNA glycosylase AlkD